MTDKQIIVTFSDGYCIVLEDNEATIRENDFTKYRIVVGDRTNELLNFVKELYLSHKFKEQECEELKEKVKKYGEINEQETKDYAELKAENERLKKEIRLYDCIDKWGTEQCRCACRCLSNEFCDAAEEKMKNIKQTLAEINRMAENTYCLTNTTNKDMAIFAEQILQKISECEVGNA